MELMEQEMSRANQPSLERQSESEGNVPTMPEERMSGNENNGNFGQDKILVSDELESPKIVASLARSQKEEEGEVMNKKEREKRDLEMLLDEDEGIFHEKEE